MNILSGLEGCRLYNGLEWANTSREIVAAFDTLTVLKPVGNQTQHDPSELIAN